MKISINSLEISKYFWKIHKKPKLIYHRIPQILHEKRKLINTRVLGIILWILLYPIAYIITYLIIDVAFIFSEKKTIEDGKKIERRRRSKES